MIHFKDKTFLITGASSGIGRASAILLSQLGARCIISARTQDELKKTLLKMDATNTTHHILPFDLTEIEKYSDFFSRLIYLTDKIDGIVHCAGISITQPLRFIDIESTDSIINLNLKSTIHLVAGARKRKILNKNSSIVLFSSTTALVGEVGISAYSASKGAVLSITKSLAAELARPEKIRVNCLVPGMVKTEMVDKEFNHFSESAIEAKEKKYPFGFGVPEDIAKAVAFFLSDATRWTTGSSLVMDGGRSLNLE